NTLKLTPPPPTVAPSGALRPAVAACRIRAPRLSAGCSRAAIGAGSGSPATVSFRLHWTDGPDVAAVVADRPIGGKAAHSSAVQDRHAGPRASIGPGLAHPLLRVDVGLIVGQQHVVVVME